MFKANQERTVSSVVTMLGMETHLHTKFTKQDQTAALAL